MVCFQVLPTGITPHSVLYTSFLPYDVIGSLMDQARPEAVITVPDLQNDDCESIQ